MSPHGTEEYWGGWGGEMFLVGISSAIQGVIRSVFL